MRMTVGRKIFSGYLVVLILMMIVGAMGFFQVNSVERNYEVVLDDRVQSMNLLKDIMSEVQQMQIVSELFLLTYDESTLEGYRSHVDRYNLLFVELEQLLSDEYERQLLFKINDLATNYYNQTNDMFNYKRQGREAEYMMQLTMVTSRIISDLESTSQEFNSLLQQSLEEIREQTSKTVDRIRLFIVVLIVSAFCLGIFVAYLIGRVITRPVTKIAAATKQIAAGNLQIDEVKVKNKDEVGDMAKSFNAMVQHLRDVVKKVSDHSEQVSIASQELTASAEQTSKATEYIASTVEDVANGAEQQVRSVMETSEGINEISRGVQHIAESANAVHMAAVDVSKKATKGNTTTKNAVEQMQSIHHSIEDLGELIQTLGSRSNQIGEIVQVISEISAQTNLLALNAAIEAARAGEHGRGFAVVADEVRKLAEQSAHSAEQIAHLIESIQMDTNRVIDSMNKATKEVHQGVNLVTSTGESFAEIQQAIQEVTEKIGDVSAAAEQIASSATQMVETVKLISQVAENAAANTQNVSSATEEQLASMEEITASSQSLSKLADALKDAIRTFRL